MQRVRPSRLFYWCGRWVIQESRSGEDPNNHLLAVLMMERVQTDMMAFDLVIFPRTYALMVFVVMLIMLASQVPFIRQMNRLSFAKVTKEQAN